MAYTSYDTPGEFFNISPTATAYSVTSATISIGCGDHATAGNRFFTNITDAQADETTGSTAQVIFGMVDGLYQRFQEIRLADSANVPTKFNVTRTGYTDETTGELVYSYTVTTRVNPSGFVAVNS